jgi:hypothetical protein
VAESFSEPRQGASHLVEVAFPGVKKRFDRAASWHFETHGIRPDFGLFYNLCVNAAFPTADKMTPSIKCLPHVDSRNGISVCVLFVYLLPGCRSFNSGSKTTNCETDEFNDDKKVWLVLWELGVVVQLPPWVYCAYPSSLLYHFNVDVDGERFQILHRTLCFTRQQI